LKKNDLGEYINVANFILHIIYLVVSWLEPELEHGFEHEKLFHLLYAHIHAKSWYTKLVMYLMFIFIFIFVGGTGRRCEGHCDGITKQTQAYLLA
jgi:hypothetical protein